MEPSQFQVLASQIFAIPLVVGSFVSLVYQIRLHKRRLREIRERHEKRMAVLEQVCEQRELAKQAQGRQDWISFKFFIEEANRLYREYDQMRKEDERQTPLG
jgi:hypothetical protein